MGLANKMYYYISTVKLVDGNGRQRVNYGRVQIKKGRWASICGGGWDDADASVVCHQLGYDDGISMCCANFGSIYFQNWALWNVACLGWCSNKS